MPPPDFDLVAEARRNWERHGWDRPEAMAAATSIARAQQIVLARADAALAPFRLTFSRFEALALLFFSRRGALPMGKVGARLQVHPTSVTNTVDRLERDGLVRRASSDGDRRTVLAEITVEGRRVVVPPPECWPRRASGSRTSTRASCGASTTRSCRCAGRPGTSRGAGEASGRR